MAPVAWARERLGFSAVDLTRAMAALQAASGPLEDYVIILHPSQEYDLRVMVAREEWRARYRLYRISLREGKIEMTPQEIMADFRLFEPQMTGEIVNMQGLNFIRTERV